MKVYVMKKFNVYYYSCFSTVHVLLGEADDALRVVVQEEFSRPGLNSFGGEDFATGDLDRSARD